MANFLFVGLGNYGQKYEKTIHNAGFIAIDVIANALNASESWKEKYSGLYKTAEFDGHKIMFVKPQTYMNNSGICVAQFKNFYKFEINNIFVFHDDIDLRPNQIKFKTGGGNGGHNGLKSLDSHIENNYHRVRIGVGKPSLPMINISNYVLSSLDNDNFKFIEDCAKKIVKNMNFFLEKQFSRVNERL